MLQELYVQHKYGYELLTTPSWLICCWFELLGQSWESSTCVTEVNSTVFPWKAVLGWVNTVSTHSSAKEMFSLCAYRVGPWLILRQSRKVRLTGHMSSYCEDYFYCLSDRKSKRFCECSLKIWFCVYSLAEKDGRCLWNWEKLEADPPYQEYFSPQKPTGEECKQSSSLRYRKQTAGCYCNSSASRIQGEREVKVGVCHW